MPFSSLRHYVRIGLLLNHLYMPLPAVQRLQQREASKGKNKIHSQLGKVGEVAACMQLRRHS